MDAAPVFKFEYNTLLLTCYTIACCCGLDKQYQNKQQWNEL